MNLISLIRKIVDKLSSHMYVLAKLTISKRREASDQRFLQTNDMKRSILDWQILTKSILSFIRYHLLIIQGVNTKSCKLLFFPSA